MLTRNDLRAVLIEALQGAVSGLRDRMEPMPPEPPVPRPAPAVADPVDTPESPNRSEKEPVAFEDRLLVSIPDAAKALGVGRSGVYQLISSGELVTVTIGRRRLVPVATLVDFVRSRGA